MTSILGTRNVNSIIFAEHGIEVLAATYVYIISSIQVVLTITYTHKSLGEIQSRECSYDL